MTVAVGIHVHAEPERLPATLAALGRPGGRPPDVLVLGDGPDPPTARALGALDLPQSTTASALGPPACFNRLAAGTSADVVILLEAGAIPAPGALDRLAGVLAAEGPTGLAGPSTNDAWNEQRVPVTVTAAPADVAHAGQVVARRFGAAVRPLAPLHSLADFCFAVRRDVIEAIGGADEGYGLGPCWEMEYSARAVRAGFQEVWVCGAFVYRPPFTERRRRAEAEAFAASRRRYQDSLCGLRLRGARPGYEPHCRGETCEHFAPAGLIRLHRPLPEAAGESRPRPARATVGEPALVTCIMPTRDRAELALHAVRLFQRQDYEPRELVIVDDGVDGLASRLPPDPRIRYLRAPAGETIGAKRNRACAEARGTFVVQWDDDDWYGERRISSQLAPLLAGRADITGLYAPLFLELEPWRCWRIDDALHRRLFQGDVHGGTLAFDRRVWEQLARYPAQSLAEDAAFLARARARGARLERVDARGLFVYVRHGANAWRLACGHHLDPGGWHEVAPPPMPEVDRAFYAARTAAAAARRSAPLATCIMPTADRRPWVPLAVDYFLRQDHPERELLVLDDGDDAVEDLMPSDSRIRYVRLDQRLVLGDKRNVACELARGEVILHWDDDDWQAPQRVRHQVEALEASDAKLCGTNRVLYFAPAAGRAWRYRYRGAHPWVAGNTLCYRRSLWRANPFASVAVGEDTRFVSGPGAGAPLVLSGRDFLAAVIHAHNSSPKLTGGAYWQPRPIEEVQSLLGSDWLRYTAGASARS